LSGFRRRLLVKNVIPASEFQFDPVNLTCTCPAGKAIRYQGGRKAENGKIRMHFEGRLLQCRHCPKKHQCMQNLTSANHRKGSGRQVAFTIENKRLPTYTDWMKHRVDISKGKEIYYSHRISVVEPVFGNIGATKRLNRFSLRGKKEYRPMAAVLPGAQYRETGELWTVGGVNEQKGPLISPF